MIFMIKLTLLQNYTHFTTLDRHLSKQTQYFIKTHTNITNFNMFSGTVLQQELRIFLCRQPTNLTNPTQSDVLSWVMFELLLTQTRVIQPMPLYLIYLKKYFFIYFPNYHSTPLYPLVWARPSLIIFSF